MSKQQIGVVGMAVMGRNLALNIESRGYTVSGYGMKVPSRFSFLNRRCATIATMIATSCVRLDAPASHPPVSAGCAALIRPTAHGL